MTIEREPSPQAPEPTLEQRFAAGRLDFLLSQKETLLTWNKCGFPPGEFSDETIDFVKSCRPHHLIPAIDRVVSTLVLDLIIDPATNEMDPIGKKAATRLLLKYKYQPGL